MVDLSLSSGGTVRMDAMCLSIHFFLLRFVFFFLERKDAYNTASPAKT